MADRLADKLHTQTRGLSLTSRVSSFVYPSDDPCDEDDEAVRSYLLHEAGVAVVPFTAFGYPEKTGWLRMSVGSVSMEAVQGTLDGLRQALSPFRTE